MRRFVKINAMPRDNILVAKLYIYKVTTYPMKHVYTVCIHIHTELIYKVQTLN